LFIPKALGHPVPWEQKINVNRPTNNRTYY
jgi:hypothetical protein